MLASGTLHSVGAHTPDGTLVGHGALHPDEPESRQGEIGMVFMDPGLRLPGCSKSILSELYAEIGRRQWVGTYGDAVTPHVQSQTIAVEMGMRDSALLVGQVLGDQQYRMLHAESAQRVSLLHMYQSLTPRTLAPWYMPDHHRAMLEAIARHLELPVEGCEGVPDNPDPGIMVARTNLSLKNGIIQVPRTGPESLGRILHLSREFRKQGLEQIQIRLSQGDAGTPALAEGLEADGFFFAGVCPNPLQGDWLVLVNLFTPSWITRPSRCSPNSATASRTMSANAIPDKAEARPLRPRAGQDPPQHPLPAPL